MLRIFRTIGREPSSILARTQPIPLPAPPLQPISRSGAPSRSANGSRRSRPRRNNACRAYCGDQHFTNVRQIGTITAVELAGGAGGYLDNVALALRSKLLTRGVLLRPLGNTVYVMPPYCATGEELKSVYQNLAEAVDEVST